MNHSVDEGTDFNNIRAVLSNPIAMADAFQNAANQTIDEVLKSEPQLRAQLIAQEIAVAQPDLVGLQEAAALYFDRQSRCGVRDF